MYVQTCIFQPNRATQASFSGRLLFLSKNLSFVLTKFEVHPLTYLNSLSNCASNTRSSRVRLCWLRFRSISTNSYNAKWWRGLCDPPTLRVSLCRGHALRQPSERSVWRLRTSGTHYRTTFATPIRCQASVLNRKHTFYSCILVMTYLCASVLTFC